MASHLSRTFKDSFGFAGLKTKMRFLAAAVCFSGAALGLVTTAKASTFDPIYADPFFNCTTGTGCCLQADMLIRDMFEGTGLYTGQQDLQIYYYKNTLFPKIETALKQFVNEIRNSTLVSIAARGAMMDGQALNLTLLSLQKQNVKSIEAQTTSDQICRFGTLSRSLANSDDRSRNVQLGLAAQMLQRETMRQGLASGYAKEVGAQIGRTSDKERRFDQYKTLFCSPKDSNGTIDANATPNPGWCTANSDVNYNRDINATGTLYNPLTLKLDFSAAGNGTKTPDEEAIMALANNLFAHDLPLNFSAGEFNSMVKDPGKISDAQKQKLVDYRALIAKRTIAQNSFAALTAMKAEGGGQSASYMKDMLKNLGIADAGAQTKYLGDKPSYYAQMDFLTRKIYQSPDFYANLMESKDNVTRQQTAMEGISLMQDRDIYKSLQRSEMVLSSLLEMYLVQQQAADKDRGTKD